jgi:hypothetical protein
MQHIYQHVYLFIISSFHIFNSPSFHPSNHLFNFHHCSSVCVSASESDGVFQIQIPSIFELVKYHCFYECTKSKYSMINIYITIIFHISRVQHNFYFQINISFFFFSRMIEWCIAFILAFAHLQSTILSITTPIHNTALI